MGSQLSEDASGLEFGRIMLALREAIPLTQAALGSILHVSRHTIGSWELGSKFPSSSHLRHFIAFALERTAFPAGREEAEIRRLWQAARQKALLDEAWLASILAHRPTPSATPVAKRLAPPDVAPAPPRVAKALELPLPPTSFLGRSAEKNAIIELLSKQPCRLLTLVGPGGTGKTRLALEVAASLGDSFPDGVVFVPLAAIVAPHQIVSAINDALGLTFVGQHSPTTALLDYLHDCRMLLALDNFENLLEGADLVAEILQRAPGVRLLVTSRQRLNLQAEWLFEVEGLSYPLPPTPPASAARPALDPTSYSAVQLFVQRALQVQPGLTLSTADLNAIVRICQQVSGMPLAIELAAANLRLFTIREVEQQLRLNLDALTTGLRDVPARHRSVRAVFDQSWQTLSEPEQVLLSRLAIFPGGASLTAATQIADATFSGLQALIDKSLLRQDTAPVPEQAELNAANYRSETRYFLLEPIREYALERLTARGETALLQRRHAEYYLTLAEEAVAQWDSLPAGAAISKLEREYVNLRAVLQWARDDGAVTLGLALATLLQKYWRQRGYYSEGRFWLEEMQALSDPDAPAQPAPPASGPILDWGEASHLPAFYGREHELTLLRSWLVEDRCCLLSVLGIGGVGKSALAITLMRDVAARFDAVIWRSLRDSPSCVALLESCLQTLAPQALGQTTGLGDLLDLLLQQLRASRVLLVLDNMETLLDENSSGAWRAGFEDYDRLLSRIAQSSHQSCLLITSREKPVRLVGQEAASAQVRTLRLASLDRESCARLLAERQISGAPADQARLINAYAGNPLALKIVAQTIADLFAGELAPFLAEGELIFGGVRDLLKSQFQRLTALEQDVLLWLAIMREPLSLAKLRNIMVRAIPAGQLLEVVDGLMRRSMVERGQQPGSFTLQSVVLEFVVAQLVAEASAEIARGNLRRLLTHSLSVAQAPDHVRQTQQRLLVAPALAYLRDEFMRQETLLARLTDLLGELRLLDEQAQGYGPANIVALLLAQQGDLRNIDLSALALRGIYLQGVEMQGASLAGSLLRDNVFTQTFDGILRQSVSANGKRLAACSRNGDIWVWSLDDYSLAQLWADHTHLSFRLAISPDGSLVAAGRWNDVVELWDVASGKTLWAASGHTGTISDMLFTPNGQYVITSAADGTIRCWDTLTGALQQTLAHSAGDRVGVWTLSCSGDGRYLASGDSAGQINLWTLHGAEPATLLKTITEHKARISELAFAPDSGRLASVSMDNTARIWSAPGGELLAILPVNDLRLLRLAWNVDDRTLALGGADPAIWLWDVNENDYRAVLRGHAKAVRDLDFTPDGNRLISGSDDGTLRIWDVTGAQCARVMQGYTVSLYSICWSPDSKQLLSGASDEVVTIFNTDGAEPRLLRGHHRAIPGLAHSPDGRWIASSEKSNILYIWDAATGVRVATLQQPDGLNNQFHMLAWSPDGQWLAATTHTNGVLLWDMSGAQPVLARQLASGSEQVPLVWSPASALLATGDNDGALNLWEVTSGALLRQFGPLQTGIDAVALSPSGRLLAATSNGADGGIYVWNVDSGAIVRSFTALPCANIGLAWSADEDQLITGCDDGALRWWSVQAGECVRAREAHNGVVYLLAANADHTRLASGATDGVIMLWDLVSGEHVQTLRRDRPYERLDISGVRGLSTEQQGALRGLGAVSQAGVL